MNVMIVPKVTFKQVLKVPFVSVTISSMTRDDELAEFSKRLNELCDDMKIPPKGLSRQGTLAKLFGVSQKGARKWLEADGYPSTSMGKRIASWGGVTFNWLISGEGPKRLEDLVATHPLVTRYANSDAATRALIELALAAPDDPIPPQLSPSVRAMVEMARTALREELKKKNADPDPG